MVLVGLLLLYLLRELLVKLILFVLGFLGIIVAFALILGGLALILGAFWIRRGPSWRRIDLATLDSSPARSIMILAWISLRAAKAETF